MLGSEVEIRATRLVAKGATETAGPAASSASAVSTAARGAAKGMILTVANICRGVTRVKGGNVASVTVSSTALKASTRSGLTTARPCPWA